MYNIVRLKNDDCIIWLRQDEMADASHWQTLSHNVVSSTPRHEQGLNSQL